MQGKLLRITRVDVDATGHLLITHSTLVKYLRKNGNTIKQCKSYLHLSNMFPISNGLKQGDELSPLLSNFAVEYTIRGGSGKQGWLEIKWHMSAFDLC